MEALRESDPARIGEFALLARLGAGGMGRVYLGRSAGGMRVAVKVILEDFAEDPGALARFRREVATLREVRSPYTAGLVDASLDRPPYWLATEFVPGPTLVRAVREAPLTPELCTGVFAALAEALATVHTRGVVHRDVKPHNVILGPGGPQLIDFGIARGDGHTQLTRTGQAPGTPGYTAPEVLLGGVAGPAADVFALGATMAAAATGRQPYGGGEWPIVSYRVVHGEIDVDGVHPGLAALIRDCVARDPALRPEPREIVRRCAVSWALAELAEYRAVQGLGAAAPADLAEAVSAGLAPTRPSRRRRVGMILAAATAVAAITTASTVWLLPDGADGRGEAGAGEAGEQGAEVESESEEPTGQGEAPALRRDFTTVHHWSQDVGTCLQAPEERLEALQWSVPRVPAVREGPVEIGWRLKYEQTDSTAPYYVVAALRPPPTTDTLGSSGLGTVFVGQTYDLSEGDPLSWRYVSYPDDFENAPPVEDLPGEWTMVLFHVQGSDQAASIACDGFFVSGGG